MSFYKITDKFSINKIISIDETSIYAQMPSSYSRCKLGKRCVLKTKNNKVFVKYTLVCAMTSKGIIGYELYQSGGMNSERMVNFINKFIKNKYKGHLIIMDNGGSHKNKNIKDVILKSNNKLLYSVPYRPKTNAIESWFSQFKHYFVIENDALTYEQLKKHVKICIKSIPKTSYKNYMDYAYLTQYVRKYTEKQSSRRRVLKKYRV
jgi:transposase